MGSTDWNAPLIEDSYRQVLGIMQARFARGDFMLGDRPGRGDFGLYGQLTQLARWDPTSMAVAVDIAPKVVHWVERMDDLSWLPVEWLMRGWSLDRRPRSCNSRSARRVRPHLRTVPRCECCSAGIGRRRGRVRHRRVDGQSGEYRQAPFGYQGKCLGWLREAYAALSDADRDRVDAVLDGTGCEQLFV